MKSVDQMSEAEMDALLSESAKPIPVGRSVDDMSEDELDELLNSKQGASPLESLAVGAAKTYTFGYQPQIETVLEGLVEPGKPFAQAIPGSDAYTKRRDELIKTQEDIIKENPDAGMSGQVLGAFLPSPINAVRMVKGASKIAQAGDTTAKALTTTAAMNPGDKEGEVGLQLGERLANVADFASDPMSIGLMALPYAPAIKDAVSDTSKATLAEKTAAMSLRPNAKDFRKIVDSGNVNIKDVGRYLIDNKLISPLKGLEETYDNLKSRMKETGASIRGFYERNADAIANYFNNNPNQLGAYQQNTFNWLNQYNEARKRVSDAYANSGQRKKALAAVEDYFADLHETYLTPQKRMRKPDLTELSEIKTGLDNRVNYEKEAKDTINEGVFKIIRNQISGAIKNELDYMGRAVGKDAVRELEDLNRRFSIEATASNLANKAYARGETSSDALYRAFGFGSGLILGPGDIPTKMAMGTMGALAAPVVREAAVAGTNAIKRGIPRALETLSTPTDIAGPVRRAQDSMNYPFVEMTPEERMQRNSVSIRGMSPRPPSNIEKAKLINQQRKMMKQQLGQ